MSNRMNGRRLEKPTDRDFDPGAVQKAVFMEAATHYTSLAGWAAAALIGVASIPGVNLIAFGIGVPLAVLAGTCAVGAGAVNFFFRNGTLTDRQVRKLLERRRQYDELLLEEIRNDMERAKFTRGVKEVGELGRAYNALTALLDNNAKYDDPEASRYRQLADTLYEAGAFNLRQLLELNRSLESRDIGRLSEELQDKERRLRRPQKGEDVEMLNRHAEELRRQVADHDLARKSYDERLLRCDETEGLLHRAAHKLSELGIGRSESTKIDWKKTASEFETAVQAAVEADKELKKAISRTR